MARKIDRSIHKMPAEQVAARSQWQGSNAAGTMGDRRTKRNRTRSAQKARAVSEYR